MVETRLFLDVLEQAIEKSDELTISRWVSTTKNLVKEKPKYIVEPELNQKVVFLTYKLYYEKMHNAADLLFYNFITDFNAVALKNEKLGLLYLLSIDDRNEERINYALKNGANMYNCGLNGKPAFEVAVESDAVRLLKLYHRKDKDIIKKYRDPHNGKHLIQKAVLAKKLGSFKIISELASQHQIELSSIKDRINRNVLQSIAEISLGIPATPDRPGRQPEAIQLDQEILNSMVLELAKNKHSFINMLRNKDTRQKNAYDLSRHENPSTYHHIETIERTLTGKSTANGKLPPNKVKLLEEKLFPQKGPASQTNLQKIKL